MPQHKMYAAKVLSLTTRKLTVLNAGEETEGKDEKQATAGKKEKRFI